ncbi:DUF3631 domain-containing protein [Catelliglobosispora koreensis]|uniref:DUF3631 domain-containing protein n=1 Tax=Catelliglobosispora koreensis TaxID=129052 RepID=UPI00037A407A|nr:DUF3631 domain-containing protein [Catelliglobosispora koreensis]
MTRKEPTTLDGAELLDRLRATIRTYVILPSNEALDAVTLWIAATHALPAWACAPRLVIRAPEKRCGKSRLLDVTEAASYNPLMTVNASPAAVYRSVGTDSPPTLLIDEYDTIFTGSADTYADLRGLLNAGHQRNRPALRYNPNKDQVEHIPTFAMAAMAGIGPAPETIEDRAVVIHMRRRRAREKVQPWRIERDRPAVAALGAELNAWLKPNHKALRDAVPLMPVEDRDADTWEPLIALADLAGGQWPIRARTAAVALTGAREERAETSDGVKILRSCWDIFNEAGAVTALPTGHILDRLKAIEDAPWSDLNAHRLGRLLREFGITSCNIRLPIGQVKGYSKDLFIDAWDRYCDLEPPQGSHLTVPSVPSVPAQLNPGTLQNAGTLQSVPLQDSVPGLTCNATLGTLGTLTPAPLNQEPAHGQTKLRLVPSAE